MRWWLIFLSTTVLSGGLQAATAKLLVKNGLFITEKSDQAPFTGYMLVGADGKIAKIALGEPAPELKADVVLDAKGQFIAPGFISAHSHLFMSPFRGLGHDATLYGWIEAINKMNNLSTAEDLYWFSLHGSVDFLRNGITTAYDFTYSGAVGGVAVGVGEKVAGPILKPGPFEENQIRAKADAGLRFIDSISIVRGGTEDDMRKRFEKVLAFARDNYSGNPLYLKMAISGNVQREPTKEAAYREAKYMHDYGVINQTHFLESPERVPEQQSKFAWYKEAGALGPGLIFGHFIQTNDEIVRETAASGASMSWQPTSNGRLASGVADIVSYRKAGIKVGVGLDDQSCTDISDPFQNLRIGLYLIRTRYKNAQSLSVKDMLYLHTLGSAEMLGIADKVGSLEEGKYADFLLVDPQNPDTGPLHDPVASYVLACGLRNLKRVYVGGELVVDGNTLVKQDEAKIHQEVYSRIGRLQAEAAKP